MRRSSSGRSRYCDLAVSQGLLAIRTHVDICDDRLLAVEALLEVKRRVAPYIDLQLVAFPQDGYYRSPTAAPNLATGARHGRRRGRRHPAFRADHGRWRAERCGALRDRGEARPARRHALRRDRRSDVAPYRDAGLRDAAARAAGPGRRLAPHLDAFDGQLLRLEAPAADRRSRRRGDRQSADQHRHPGPPRHLSQAPRHDARARRCGGTASTSPSARIA